MRFRANRFLLSNRLGYQRYFVGRIKRAVNGEFSAQTLSLPYAFYNESFGFAAGYAYGVVGRPQKQATLLTTAMVGSKGSAMGFLIGRDLQMPRVDRLFLDPVVSVGYFKDNEAFVDGNSNFPDEINTTKISKDLSLSG